MSSATPTTPESAPRTNQHYDQDPALFELFLDPTLKYSSGLFGDGIDSLHAAQLAKMDFVAEKLRARSGARVLDVGCGWGALMLHLATRYQCSVLGVTPSPSQARYVAQRARAEGVEDRVAVTVGTFDAIDFGRERFDAVSMLGSITHMEDKPGAVEKARKLLRRNGWFYLSESSFRNHKIYEEFDHRPGSEFIRNRIFGWGELLPFSSYVRYCEDAGFSLDGLRDLTGDYARTIEFWRANAVRNRDAIDALQPGKTDELLTFFDICNAGWGMTAKHYALLSRKSR